MEYTRSFQGARMTNPRGARELRQRFDTLLAEHGVGMERYEITAGDETVDYDSVEDFCTSAMLPRADGCRLYMATYIAGEMKLLRAQWSRGIVEEWGRVSVSVNGFDEGTALGLVSHAKACLGVEAARGRRVAKWRGVPRSAFLGYAFDSAGQEVAAFVRELLELVDFAVVSGEPFAPTGVSDKIKDRIREQGIAVCVFTEGEPSSQGGPRYSDWVRDEATFAGALGKPLFVLVEESVGQIPGIHGDLEYIAFRRGDLARAGLKLLQGLGEAGFALSPKPPPVQRRIGVMTLLRALLRRGPGGEQDAG
jgi:hypothetical protein